MMRTVEVLMVIIILTGAFMATSYFAVLPWPRQVSPLDLGRLSLTTLETLNSGNDLSEAAFDTTNVTAWQNLQVALSASLPPNVIYNLTVYNVNNGAEGSALYTLQQSVSNAANLGLSSDASSYLVSSSNVTFNPTPQKIGETASGGGGITLYILNCSDSNGWWITGFSAQSLAQDFYNLLSPYFARTVVVQNTAQLGQLLNGDPLKGETLQNAVFINTCGEAVPIPTSFSGSPYSEDGYANYCYLLGQKVNQYNWTWSNIVGYPFYYVTNTGQFPNDQNTWGIYGMECVGSAGLNSFLQGISNQPFTDNGNWITSDLSSTGPVYMSSEALGDCNYYGIYPSPYQTFTRALPTSIVSQYNLDVTTNMFGTVSGCNPGAMYRHTTVVNGKTNFQGGFFALGLTRTPDVRLTALGLLCDYSPRIYSSDFNSYDTSRMVVLQLGLVGGT
jgi:hypothetical protein